MTGFTRGALPGQTNKGGSDAFVLRFATAPFAPQDLAAIAADGRVDLTWSAPAFDGGSPITSYRVYRGTQPGSLSFLADVGLALTYTDTNFIGGQAYYYAVTVASAMGESARSNVASALAQRPPTAPQGLTRKRS